MSAARPYPEASNSRRLRSTPGTGRIELHLDVEDVAPGAGADVVAVLGVLQLAEVEGLIGPVNIVVGLGELGVDKGSATAPTSSRRLSASAGGGRLLVVLGLQPFETAEKPSNSTQVACRPALYTSSVRSVDPPSRAAMAGSKRVPLSASRWRNRRRSGPGSATRQPPPARPASLACSTRARDAAMFGLAARATAWAVCRSSTRTAARSAAGSPSPAGPQRPRSQHKTQDCCQQKTHTFLRTTRHVFPPAARHRGSPVQAPAAPRPRPL